LVCLTTSKARLDTFDNTGDKDPWGNLRRIQDYIRECVVDASSIDDISKDYYRKKDFGRNAFQSDSYIEHSTYPLS